MTDLLPPTGRYALIGKRAYAVRTRGGRWILWSADPQSVRDGFVGAVKGGYERDIAQGEDLQVFRRSYSGSYRGLPVEVFPNRIGTLMLTTSDSRASGLGFEPLERTEWTTVVPPKTPGLTFSEVRTPTPAPWRSDAGERDVR